MTRELYIRPVGLRPAQHSDEIEDVRGVLPLAQGIFDFTALEVLRRRAGGTSRRILGHAEFAERDWGAQTDAFAQAYDALLGKRQPIGRLTLDRPRLMGIVNVTPDSFSGDGIAGGRTRTRLAVVHALDLIAQGAHIIDIGGESTRPGAEPVPLQEELARVIPVIEGVRAATDTLISVDTRKAEVMRRAAEAGADLINDVSALTHDPDSLAVAAESGCGVVLMHARGDPKTMQDNPSYADVLLDVYDFLATRIAACADAGLARDRLIADPGIGFGKTLEHNLRLMSGLSLFHGLGVPVLVGASRKTFIGGLTGVEAPPDRLAGSVSAALAAAAQGAQILRVHDVKATREALDVWLACLLGEGSPKQTQTSGAT